MQRVNIVIFNQVVLAFLLSFVLLSLSCTISSERTLEDALSLLMNYPKRPQRESKNLNLEKKESEMPGIEKRPDTN